MDFLPPGGENVPTEGRLGWRSKLLATPPFPQFYFSVQKFKKPGKVRPGAGLRPQEQDGLDPAAAHRALRGFHWLPRGWPQHVSILENSASVEIYKGSSVTAGATTRGGPRRGCSCPHPFCVGSQTRDAQHGCEGHGRAQTRDTCRARGTGARTQASHPTFAYAATDFFFHKIKAILCARTHNLLFLLSRNRG